ncbi:MAG: RNA polymerase sigma factor [Phycisphaerae bacterium]|nr:RNA polymerase sigma factor [Phycisphaerae bacterium]
METMDPNNLTQWYDRCAAELALYAGHILKCHGSEDIVQDVFIKLMAQNPQPDNVRAWLFTAVRNAAITRLRKIKRRRKLREKLQVAKPWFLPTDNENFDSSEIQNALENLDDELREIVILRIWGQLTLKEIAALLDCSTTTVYVRFDKAIRTMQKTLCIDNFI